VRRICRSTAHERLRLSLQPEAAQARYSGKIRIPNLVLGALLLAAASSPLLAQTAPPHVASLTPIGGQRGTTVELTVSGVNIGRGTDLLLEGEGLTVEAVTPEKPAPSPTVKPGEKPPEPPKNPTGKLTARLRIAPDAEPGIRTLRVVTPVGVSDVAWFAIGQWPEVAEREPNNTRDRAQKVPLPVTVNGRIDPAEDVDMFRFRGKAGQTLVFDLLAARLGSPLDSILSLQDSTGRELAVNDDFNGKDSLLAFTVPADGDYFLVLRDLNNQGGSDHQYRLTMGEIPYVVSAFPIGGRPGASLPLELDGYNLGAARTVPVTLPAVPEAAPMALPLTGGLSNPVTLAVDEAEAPEITEIEPNDDPARAQRIPVPAIVNGRIAPAGAVSRPDVDCYRFRAEKGRTLALEVFARRYGSELDSVLTVTDAAGKELATNDDAVGKDSRLEFTPPETGEYVARVTDLQERGGPNFPYRLSITFAVPDFRLSYVPDRLAVGQGGRVPLTVTAERLHDFDGEIPLAITGLPKGVSVLGPARIRARQKVTTVVLTAAPDAAIQASRLQVAGTVTVDGRTIHHAAQAMEEIGQNDQKSARPARLPAVALAEPPDVVVSAAPDKLALAPGKSAEIVVKIERKKGFTAKVPLAVLGLPAGVTADAPEIAEGKAEGKITLKAEEGAKPGGADLVVVGKSVIDDQQRVSHAALPMILTLSPAGKKP
jgi:hypothetical protein